MHKVANHFLIQDEGEEFQDGKEDSDEENWTGMNLIIPSQREIEAPNFELEAPCNSQFLLSENSSDESTSINDEHSPKNHRSQSLSSQELALWTHFQAMTSINQFEHALPNEHGEHSNEIDSRSTRSFQGAIFH